MTLLKITAVLGMVLVVSNYAYSSMDFSAMNFARSTMMAYAGGTQRTVQVLKPIDSTQPVGNRGTKVVLTKRKGGGWSSGRRRRYKLSRKKKPKAKRPTFVRQTKTYKRRTTPSNKFLEALTAIDRGVADAKAAGRWLKYSPPKMNALKNTITLASRKRMFQYSRLRLGEAFYLLQNIRSSRRPKRSTKAKASKFITDLKQTMGAAKFDEFMAVMGDVTLMFAIDTTGSMSNDIQKAKKIAIDVINYPRQNPVSYILSPFNDPGTGPVTFKTSSEGALFVNAINKLNAHGGGDCPEYTLKGILDALYEGPDWGSPLYVFTDASAKDATAENMEDVKSMAQYVGATINFFTTGTCGSKTFKPFQELADATSGQVLSLSNHQELKKLTGFTGSVLGGSNVISAGSNMSNRKKRRSVGNHRYRVKVDDSIEKMSVCVTTTRPNQGAAISLITPSGTTVTSGKVSMSKVSVYEITKPSVGTWSLVVTPSAGEHSYFVKSTSDSNIDFEYYFTHNLKKRRTEVPIQNPLIGQQTKVILTLAGYHKVQKNTVVLELITKHGEHIRDVTLQPDSQGMRYLATITPPSQTFKLKVKGTTKAGNSSFERVSRNIVEPKYILLRILRSNRDFTLRRGQRTRVTFHLFNAANVNKVININVKDRQGYTAPLSNSRRTIRAGKWAFFNVEFNTPQNAVVGSGDTAIVAIAVQGSSERTSLPVQLIVNA